jgi:hypothetical protein
VDSVPDPLLLRQSGSAGNRSRTSGFIARNCDHCLHLFLNIFRIYIYETMSVWCEGRKKLFVPSTQDYAQLYGAVGSRENEAETRSC